MSTPDFLIVGGGIVGLSVARELRRRDPGARIRIVEKEARVGVHASGSNSGVLHAGLYYTPDSLKARFTGNERLTRYCLERKLPILRCGKLVVARSEEELPRLEELERRGAANGVVLTRVSAAEIFSSIVTNAPCTSSMPSLPASPARCPSPSTWWIKCFRRDARRGKRGGRRAGAGSLCTSRDAKIFRRSIGAPASSPAGPWASR
ncbi:MAG: FAD-dependent oxidoreductase, partial [Acidobacteriota bacterium]